MDNLPIKSGNMHTLIIAEAGVNHNGSIELARSLIDVADEAGADFVKFQTFKAERIVSKTAGKAEYQKRNVSDEDNSQFAMLKKLELTEAMHFELIDYCKEKRIQFLSTGFDTDSIDFLDRLKIPFFKIPSGEITNKPYLRHIAQKRKPVVMSTGMADMKEIGDALSVLTEGGLTKDQITVLHCNTDYPTPMEEVNLRAMLAIRDAFNVEVGYSDHTQGIEVPVAAVALGAAIIEKHFTLDRNFPGPDHLASLEPDELKLMIRAIRNVEKAMAGTGKKEPAKSELNNIVAARKSIVAAGLIHKGELFTIENLAVKRPGNGVSPMLWDSVIGREAKRDFHEDEMIEL